jgi:hypothetical protein
MNNKDNNVPIHKMNTDTILIELIKKQKKIIPVDKKLLLNDIKRISKYLTSSIFGNECSLWTGYITVIKNDEKNSYVNFYYCGKKYALHRLLYQNFIGDLLDSEYIKFKCPNKGKCCNINHFYKINRDDNSCPEPKNDKTTTNTELNPDGSMSKDSDDKNSKKNIIVDFNL